MGMRPDKEKLEQVRNEIVPAYESYIHHVSHPHMAISLETASWVGLLAQNIGSAVDFGSGFTSFVLRKYCTQVWSVDDNPEWLEKTAEFCASQSVSTERIVLMGHYLPGKHDVVVHDYAGGELRNAWSEFAVDQVAPGGIVVFDDMQHGPHQDAARAAADLHGMKLSDESRGWTLDAVSRWAAHAVR